MTANFLTVLWSLNDLGLFKNIAQAHAANHAWLVRLGAAPTCQPQLDYQLWREVAQFLGAQRQRSFNGAGHGHGLAWQGKRRIFMGNRRHAGGKRACDNENTEEK